LIVSKTPIRISMGAGGTDLPGFYSKYGAKFATSSGSKYTYVMVNQHPEKIVWMGLHQAERVESPDQLRHNIVREVLKHLDIRKNIEIVSVSDVLPNSGLGTSSSFVVGLLNALHAYRGEFLWPEEIAEEACFVEQKLLREQTGKQDQYAAALGGIIWLDISKSGNVAASRLRLDKDFTDLLVRQLAFFYTRIQRSSNEVQHWHNNGDMNDDELLYLQKIKEVAIEIRTALEKQDIIDLGRLMDSHWQYKRKISDDISNEQIDNIYRSALNSGAIGGNLMGAGGGGHFLFVCKDEKSKTHISKEMSKLGLLPVNLRFSMQGSIVTDLS
jgi:D-glycero-alpha-D-manno-heptose-7-phosphate kinase